MNHLTLTTVLLVASATIAGCASAPVTLIALPPAAAATVPANEQSSGVTLRVRNVKLPSYLDTFPVVVGRADNSLVVAQNFEWAERLSDSVPRVLREALSQRLRTSRVLVAGERRLPDAELAVEFIELDPRDGALDLDARWFLACGTEGGRGGRIRLQVPLERATAPAVAAATTQALVRFAEVLATEIECARNSDRVVTVR